MSTNTSVLHGRLNNNQYLYHDLLAFACLQILSESLANLPIVQRSCLTFLFTRKINVQWKLPHDCIHTVRIRDREGYSVNSFTILTLIKYLSEKKVVSRGKYTNDQCKSLACLVNSASCSGVKSTNPCFRLGM